MPVRLFGQTFSPPLWALVVYLVVCALMLGLGRWQLQRADEKIEILSAAESAATAPPVALSSLPDTGSLLSAAAAYRRVEVAGQWLSGQQLLWDNRAHASQAGVEIITPLRLHSGEVVLVNRGWTPLGARRSITPDVSLDNQGDVHISGSLSRPSRGFAKGEAFDQTAPWPRYLQYFDYASIGGALQAEVLPVVLQADHTSTGPWLVENWQPAASGPEKHYAYAVQWFGMAAALTVIFLVVNRQRLAPATRTA